MSALDPSNRFIVRIAYKRGGILKLMSGPRRTVPGVPYFPLCLPAPDAELSAEGSDTPIIPLHLDPRHVKSSLFTKYKSSYRDKYHEARARVGFDDSVASSIGEILL